MSWESGLSLGEVIARLEQEDPSLVLPIGWSDVDSYRGYYECVAFEPAENVTVADCLAIARRAVGATFGGYKGGDYHMDEDTECYLAPYGDTGDCLTATTLELNIRLGKAVISRAPRPLYVNHPRTEAAVDDIVNYGVGYDGRSIGPFMYTSTERWAGSPQDGRMTRWVGLPGGHPDTGPIYNAGRLRLLVDGETGQVVQ